jgi:uncharacterized alkaline shock family protein YloU
MTDQEKYEDIIEQLATGTVSEVEGVVDITQDSGATFTGRVFRSKNSGIIVTLIEELNQAVVEVNIKAYNGYRVPDLAYEIQTKIKQKVEGLTPYTVKTINVNVVGVVFK